MTVFVDAPTRYPGKRGLWSHLWASRTCLADLHRMAERIGLKRCWFQNRRGRGFPHYDLTGSKIDLAVKAGAIRSMIREWLKTPDGAKAMAECTGGKA